MRVTINSKKLNNKFYYFYAPSFLLFNVKISQGTITFTTTTTTVANDRYLNIYGFDSQSS